MKCLSREDRYAARVEVSTCLEGSTRFDILGEGDLAAGVVVPGAFADLGFLPVRGAFGGPSGGVGAGGALSAFGVVVASDEALVAVVVL